MARADGRVLADNIAIVASVASDAPTDTAVKAVRAAERKRQAQRARRERDVIDVRRAPSEHAPNPTTMPPTPEQAAKAVYVEDKVLDVSEGRRSLRGSAFQRRARFETIEGLTALQLRALRQYRTAFDDSNLSEVKSQLDIGPGGGGGGSDAALARIERIAFADVALRAIEARVPIDLLPTLRAVACEDKDFKQVAIERFGGRTVSRIDTSAKHPKVTTSIEPRSGRHRTRIREEFMDGVVALADGPKARGAVARTEAGLPTTAESPQSLAPPKVDPAFLDESGFMKPWREIADILRERAGSP